MRPARPGQQIPPRFRFQDSGTSSRPHNERGVGRFRIPCHFGADTVTPLLKNAVQVLGGIAGDRRRRRALRVVRHSDWCPELDAALATLPEMDSCPHELFRMVATNPGPAAKQTLLVIEKDLPLAIVALRQRHSDWVPVTHYHLPGRVFGQLGSAPDRRAAARLGWPFHGVVATTERPAWHRKRTSHEVDADFQDRVRHGRRGQQACEPRDHLNDVKRMRKRCEPFRVVVDFPGGMEWVTRKWEEKWRSPGDLPAADLDDRLLAARYLEERRAHHSVIVLDGDRPIGGNTYIVHDHELVWMYTYREPEYDAPPDSVIGCSISASIR